VLWMYLSETTLVATSVGQCGLSSDDGDVVSGCDVVDVVDFGFAICLAAYLYGLAVLETVGVAIGAVEQYCTVAVLLKHIVLLELGLPNDHVITSELCNLHPVFANVISNSYLHTSYCVHSAD
jgi:hypothetical protein